MSSYAVPVNYSPGLNQVILRDLRGHQEQAVEGTGTLDALLLLDGLLLRMQDGKLPCKPPELATADRDRLLAAIYKRTYLDKIESAITCEACQSAFDLDFSLDALLTQLQPDKTLEGIARLDDGTFRLAGGVHFRLPTGEDELAVLGLSPDEAAHLLLKRCLLDGDLEQDTARMQEAMQVIAPLMDMDLAACCPECGHQQCAVIARRRHAAYEWPVIAGFGNTSGRRRLHHVSCSHAVVPGVSPAGVRLPCEIQGRNRFFACP